MQLEELLGKITKLPWQWVSIRSTGEQGSIDRKYSRHAANVLPGLVKAVREYTKERDYQNVEACKHDQDRLEKLLLAEVERAEKVEAENTPTSVAAQSGF